MDDEGLHGMVEKCGTTSVTAGDHVVYVEGFQAGGGVGMAVRYSGPDTGGRKVLMRSGASASALRLRLRRLQLRSRLRRLRALRHGLALSQRTGPLPAVAVAVAAR